MKEITSLSLKLSTPKITICVTAHRLGQIRPILNTCTFFIFLFFLSFGSEKMQAQWSSTNYAAGNINTVFCNGNDVLAGTNGGDGVSYSSNNGINWGAANTGMTQYPDVRAFAANTTYIYAGTTTGVYRSLNNGTYNWTKVLNNASCFSLLTNGADVFAGTMGGGVYFSSDNGTNWTQVNSGLTMLHVYALAFNGTYLFAGTYHNGSTPGQGVFRSNDNGQTWTQVNNGLTNSTIMCFATKGGHIFAGTNGGGIFRSLDNGDNWTNMAGGVAHTLKVVCETDIYAGFLSGGGISRSTDNGSTWTAYSTGLPNTGGYTVTSIDASSTNLFSGSLGGGVARAENTCPTKSDACITWDLMSSQAVSSTTGNIAGQAEIISQGSSAPFMQVYGYSNDQRLWVGNTGWIPFPTNSPAEDPLRFLEFNATATAGNTFTVNSISFNYGDSPLTTDFNILSFVAYYSTNNWSTRTILNSSALIYKNTAMNTFNVSGLSVPVSSGQNFSLRIYPYPILNGIAMTPTFAIHNNVLICGTTKADKTGSICGQKFNDLNGNGLKDLGENGLENWIINMRIQNAAGWIIISDTTDASGDYCFNNLIPGTYSISETQQSAWTQTFPASPGTHSITLTSDMNSTGNNFGNKQIEKPSSICGQKFNDLNGNGLKDLGENGLENWIINIKIQNAAGWIIISDTTDVNGNYCFNNLIPGTYTISETQQSGWTQTFPASPGTHSITLTSDMNSTGNNFGNKQIENPASICGKKFNDLNGNGNMDNGESGLPNWSINLTYNPGTGSVTLTQITDANGNYCFNNLQPGITYVLSELMQSGWSQTLPGAPFTYTVTALPSQNYTLFFGNKLDDCVKNWTSLTSGTNGEVWALAVIGTDLYVGGNFTTAGGNTANHIAKWDGAAWSPLVSANNGVNGINGMVSALTVIGTDLYVGGWFTSAGGIPALNIAKWDGSNWTALGSGISAVGAINALTVMGNDIYATSYISDSALGGPGHIIAKWNGSSWSHFSTMNDYVSTFLVDGTNLYAGGQFTMIGTVAANHIAKWDGTNWLALGSGTDYYIGGSGLQMLAGKLYVGGKFSTAGGNAANHIASWNGTNWASFVNGSNIGMDNSVEGFAVIGSDLYASGSFLNAVGVSAHNVARWNGTVWLPLGTGMNDGVWRLAVVGSDLYAGGIFTTAGSNSANYIAKYSCSLPTAISELKLNQQNQLSQNQPNPFNSNTLLKFNISKTSFVKLSVHDVFGREIKVLVNEIKEVGNYERTFDGEGLLNGIYFYTLSADGYVQSKKMILMK